LDNYLLIEIIAEVTDGEVSKVTEHNYICSMRIKKDKRIPRDEQRSTELTISAVGERNAQQDDDRIHGCLFRLAVRIILTIPIPLLVFIPRPYKHLRGHYHHL
jgi:hypothetical protein